jgi:hypothetical protein
MMLGVFNNRGREVGPRCSKYSGKRVKKSSFELVEWVLIAFKKELYVEQRLLLAHFYDFLLCRIAYSNGKRTVA